MPAVGPTAAAYDRTTVAAVYSIMAAAASLLSGPSHYASHLPFLWQALEPASNGIVGGVVAGSVAITVYRIDKRSKSRDKKFVPARALAAELDRTLDAVQPAGGGSPRASRYIDAMDSGIDSVQPAPSSKSAAGRAVHGGAESGMRPDLPPEVPRQVYEGLAGAGGVFQIEPMLQMRLHVFYEHAKRGDLGAVAKLIRPLVREVTLLRDANAPFEWSSMARPPRRAASRLRGRSAVTRKRPEAAGASETAAYSPAGEEGGQLQG